jgi:hypothetical protein
LLEIGAKAAEEALDIVMQSLSHSHMVSNQKRISTLSTQRERRRVTYLIRI